MLGRKLTLDPVRQEFIGDDQANRLRSRATREPWCLSGRRWPAKMSSLAWSEIEPVRGLGLAAVEADARSESWRIDADRRRRGNLVDGQTGAVDDREGAVRVPRGGCSVDVTGRGEAGTPEADAITAGKEAVARDVRAVGGPGIGRESGERSRNAVAGEAVARPIKPGAPRSSR